MMKLRSSENVDGSSGVTHQCSLLCLGPLTFHSGAVGDKVNLSHGNQRAERSRDTFKNGLVFSSRPLKLEERLRLRVEKNYFKWNGALRVGFTNVSPSERSLPLPSMAIPDLTNTPGHWAVGLSDSVCQEGSELEFWVSNSGTIKVSWHQSETEKLLSGVDISRPLWAMIDIYGQTYSISLLGSEKQGVFCRRSCPPLEPLPSPRRGSHLSLVPDVSDSDEDGVDISADNRCVVCMRKEARVTLSCGHRCLCRQCSSKVFRKFGTCPLCRHTISYTYVQTRLADDLTSETPDRSQQITRL